jgi:uncharacterized protein YfaP (DUF2135 family)
VDWLEVVAATTGRWSIVLGWDDAASDYDLFVVEPAGGVIAQSADAGPAQPESVEFDVVSSQHLLVAVAAWEGGPGAWNAVLE